MIARKQEDASWRPICKITARHVTSGRVEMRRHDGTSTRGRERPDGQSARQDASAWSVMTARLQEDRSVLTANLHIRARQYEASWRCIRKRTGVSWRSVCTSGRVNMERHDGVSTRGRERPDSQPAHQDTSGRSVMTVHLQEDGSNLTVLMHIGAPHNRGLISALEIAKNFSCALCMYNTVLDLPSAHNIFSSSVIYNSFLKP